MKLGVRSRLFLISFALIVVTIVAAQVTLTATLDRWLTDRGLGLSIVKHLCEAMGGSVSVESEVGRAHQQRLRVLCRERVRRYPVPGSPAACG